MVEPTEYTLAGIRILEPVTTVTDLLVTAVCFYAFIRLKRRDVPVLPHISLYRYFFLFMGLATLIGGLIGHAFIYAFDFDIRVKVPGWIVSMISIALAERAAIMRAKPLMNPGIGRFFAVLNLVELITFMIISVYTLQFIYVEIHGMYGMLIVVFSFECYVYIKTRDRGSSKVMWAVFLGACAAIAHIGKISIHTWFNYFDLAHLFMAASCWVLYMGVRDELSPSRTPIAGNAPTSAAVH